MHCGGSRALDVSRDREDPFEAETEKVRETVLCREWPPWMFFRAFSSSQHEAEKGRFLVRMS